MPEDQGWNEVALADRISTGEGTLLTSEEGGFMFVTPIDQRDYTLWLQACWMPNDADPLTISTFQQYLRPLRSDWQRDYCHWQVRSNTIALVVDDEGCVKEIPDA